MKKILPVTEPYFSTYPATGHALSILQSHPETTPWILNNFIQIFTTDEITLDYFDFNLENCPFLIYNSIEKKMALDHRSLIEFIIQMIDNDYYVSFMLDTSKISNYDFKWIHDPMIFGYDTEKEVVYFADHFQDRKYSYQECSFAEINAAYGIFDSEFLPRNKRSFEDFRLFKYNTDLTFLKVELFHDYDNRYSLLKDRVKTSLIDYLEERPTMNWYTRAPFLSKEEQEKHRFGIGCYDILKKHLDNVWNERRFTSWSLQSFYVMYSHKMIMNLRYDYMLENEMIQDKDLKKELLRLEDLSNDMLNFFLKEIFKKKFLFERKEILFSFLDDIRMKEKDVLLQFIELI